MEEIKLDSLDDIDLGGGPEISLDSNSELKTANFGNGIELLMNEKVKNSKKSDSSNNLKNLESEIMEINETVLPSEINKEIKFEEKDSFQNKPNIEIAKATSSMEMGIDTWDAFKNINSNKFLIIFFYNIDFNFNCLALQCF